MNNIESSKGEIVMYQPDETIRLEVRMDEETVWLSANQMADLFDRDEKTIRKHINNVFSENEVPKDINTHFLRVDGVKQPVALRPLIATSSGRHLLRRTDLRCLRTYHQPHQTGEALRHPHRQLYQYRYPDDAQQPLCWRDSHDLHPSTDPATAVGFAASQPAISTY